MTSTIFFAIYFIFYCFFSFMLKPLIKNQKAYSYSDNYCYYKNAMCLGVLAVFHLHNFIGLTFNLCAIAKCFEPQLHYLTLMSPRFQCIITTESTTYEISNENLLSLLFSSSATRLLTHSDVTRGNKHR